MPCRWLKHWLFSVALSICLSNLTGTCLSQYPQFVSSVVSWFTSGSHAEKMHQKKLPNFKRLDWLQHNGLATRPLNCLNMEWKLSFVIWKADVSDRTHLIGLWKMVSCHYGLFEQLRRSSVCLNNKTKFLPWIENALWRTLFIYFCLVVKRQGL